MNLTVISCLIPEVSTDFDSQHYFLFSSCLILPLKSQQLI
uniref:Uncharacterized protein n=1 Tax=Arundo donax TaxID=35708 RepID=A0A0A8YFU5_ARUDO